MLSCSCAMCALQIYPTNPNRTDLLLLIGAIYYQLGNYQECIAFNDRCILLDAQMAEAHANLANALQQLGNFDMAIIYYQVGLTLCMPVHRLMSERRPSLTQSGDVEIFVPDLWAVLCLSTEVAVAVPDTDHLCCACSRRCG